MREIKFRAWDKDRKKMVHFTQPPTVISEYNVLTWEVDEEEEKEHFGCLELYNFELMQFTGLFDKNGKEIYEGDIVEWKYLQTWHKNEVRWVGGGFVVTTSGFKDDLNEPQDLSLVSILSCEIIGNIYENPELLDN